MLSARSIQASSARALCGLPEAFWWLWGSTLINRLGTFVVPFLTLYLTTSQGRSVGFAGLTAAVVGMGGMAGSVAGGSAADHVGRRRVLLVSHAATATATVALGLSTSDEALVGSAFLIGFFAATSRPATSALINDILAERDRVRAFSLNHWAMNLGFAVSVIFAGVAAEVGYRLLFLADAGATALCALILYRKVPEPARTSREATAARGEGFRSLLADKPFLLCAALFAVISAVLQQMTVTLPVAMSEIGLSPATCGVLIALNGLLICLFQVPAGPLLSRFPPLVMLALGAALIGLGFGVTAWAASAAFLALTVTVWTAGEIISGPISMELTARFAGKASQGRYQGVTALAWALGGTFAAAAGGYTYDRFGSDTLWLGCGLAGIMTAIGFLLLRVQHGRDDE
ncbi:MDR family MFS transporter [Streptomyces coeruleorubidus]|uniref:MDR family MFS transporter n=1 Tax=Streptomyces coeruleorubidus TaxID=116188 RepID=UPI003660B52F